MTSFEDELNIWGNNLAENRALYEPISKSKVYWNRDRRLPPKMKHMLTQLQDKEDIYARSKEDADDIEQEYIWSNDARFKSPDKDDFVRDMMEEESRSIYDDYYNEKQYHPDSDTIFPSYKIPGKNGVNYELLPNSWSDPWRYVFQKYSGDEDDYHPPEPGSQYAGDIVKINGMKPSRIFRPIDPMHTLNKYPY